MKSSLYRISTMILVFAAVMSLAACGDSGKETEQGQNTQTSSSSGTGSAEAGPAENTIEFERTGVSFVIPDSWSSDKLTVNASYGSAAEGVKYTSALMYSLSGDEMDALRSECEDDDNKYAMMLNANAYTLFYVFSIDGGRGEKELREVLSGMSSAKLKISKLGSAGEWSFFSVVEEVKSPTPSSDKKQAVEAALSDAKKVLKSMKFSEPVPFKPAEVGSEIAFAAEDLRGNVVLASEYFSKNKITLINIWNYADASSVEALQYYGLLAQSCEENGCGMMGVVHDYDADNRTDILFDTKKAGVSYLMVSPSFDFDELLPTETYPTTYFVDSEGKVLCAPVEGNDFEKLAEVLNELLAKQG